MSDESLLYAFSSLLNNLGIQVDYNTLRTELEGEDLSFDTLAQGEYVHIVEKGEYGSWPTSNNAIIRFQYQDQDEPYIEVDGNRDANIIDHYCLVADYEQKTIVDSADGVVKEPVLYGHPVSWAMFEPGSAPKAATPKFDEERSYKVLKGGESGWQIAQKLNIPAKDLEEHNADDVEDFGNIPEGTILHLPIRPDPKPKAKITEFEFLRRGLEMHVSKAGGTRKYTFGSLKSKADLKLTGPVAAENKNLLIFAIAHVPIGDETLTFYMEAGDVDTSTKKVRWTVGFAQDDVAEGHMDPSEAPAPQVKEIIQTKLDEAAERKKQLDEAQAAKKAKAMERLAMIDDVNDQDNPPSKRMNSDTIPTIEEERAAEVKAKAAANRDWWKTTYKPFPDRQPRVYVFNRDMVVQDFGHQCRNKFISYLEGVKIGGDFVNADGIECWRPQDAADNFVWYGIPKVDPETGEPNLILDDDLHDTKLSLAERSTGRYGRLTPVERYFTVPLAKATSKSPLLQRYTRKLKQNKE